MTRANLYDDLLFDRLFSRMYPLDKRRIYPMHLAYREAFPLQIFPRSEYYLITSWIDIDYVKRFGEPPQIEPLPLPYRETVNTLVLSYLRSIFKNEFSSRTATTDLRDEVLNTPRDKADILALWFFRGNEPSLSSDLSDFRLRIITDRKKCLLQLVLSAGIEEIALVLVAISSA